MKLGSSRAFDEREFTRLRDELSARAGARRAIRRDLGAAPAVPDEVGLQLTNRCNLRCKECFQWNDEGHHHRLPVVERDGDLPFEIAEAVLAATSERRSNVYLWGGEPLIYRHWERLAERLVADPRWTVLCTNGMAIEARLPSLLAMSANLATLVSLDGLETENDALRGRGTFKRVTRGVKSLVERKAAGEYQGEISISAVISEALIPRLLEFVEYVDSLGVNTLYLVFPWFITSATAERMDSTFRHRFGWLREVGGVKASWHSYGFHIGPDHVAALKQALAEIMARSWSVRIRLQPSLEADEIEAFVRGEERPAQNLTRCTAVAGRLSVLPSGSVTTCKLFPEFAYAQLDPNSDSVLATWGGDQARKLRSELGSGLLPICGKCVQLYQGGC